MKLIGWETLLRRKEAILTKITVTKMFDALLSQFFDLVLFVNTRHYEKLTKKLITCNEWQKKKEQ